MAESRTPIVVNSIVCNSLPAQTQTLICIWMAADFKSRRRWWHPTPVLLPGKSHGQRSLVSCSPWGHEESDMTERLHFHFSLPCIGEGNGNPLQCSCLENPRDGGAWWAAINGVTQNRTRLKRLSSSAADLLGLFHLAKLKFNIHWTASLPPTPVCGNHHSTFLRIWLL